MARGVCSFSECGREVYGHGLCNTHWSQKRRGKELSPIRRHSGWGNNVGKICGFDGCNRAMKWDGLCPIHKQQLLNHGVMYPVGDMRKLGFKSGNTYKDAEGYVMVYEPLHPMSKANGCILLHRKIMSDLLGRPLLPSENVHHKNGIRDDNRPENLELWVTMQPRGQRVEDLLEWAQEVFDRYGEK